jgi:hypothetical protein
MPATTISLNFLYLCAIRPEPSGYLLFTAIKIEFLKIGHRPCGLMEGLSTYRQQGDMISLNEPEILKPRPLSPGTK